MIRLEYDKGTIVIRGMQVPNSRWDDRVNAYRALAMYYRDIVDYLKASKIRFEDRVLDLVPCPALRLNLELKDYQEDAVRAWVEAGKRGVMVMPTGSGKTFVAMKAMSIISEATLVVVPTLDLMDQWATRLSEMFNVSVGVYGGGEHVLGPVTVATYDTAYLRIEELGNKFSLIVFDEVHHLPSPGYSQIAEMSAAPYRMGLTATYERADGLHVELARLIGGVRYEVPIRELAGRHLAEYEIRRILVDLSPEEREEYEKAYSVYVNYLREHNLSMSSPEDFRKLVLRSGRDPRAREALLARHKARTISINSSAKLDALTKILERHVNDRIIIFTEHNSLVYAVSTAFLIPAITHKTPKKERSEILSKFRNGEYRAVVTSKVLDEGVDVPEANVGVILGGSGSKREFIQRLGRLLRKKEGKRAVLYEIVSKSSEIAISKRRRKGLEQAT
ncbi:MAG: DEAD/DEAH box helicase family protein [Candidatus Freyarchaeota archaeon]|nr:DEAD/DEAH box helicase family protein [Candidatus Freyrarchaeum guaymaensis]